jgi:hypothetical protein
MEQTSTAFASAASGTLDVPAQLCAQILACHEQVAQSWPPTLLEPTMTKKSINKT